MNKKFTIFSIVAFVITIVCQVIIFKDAFWGSYDRLRINGSILSKFPEISIPSIIVSSLAIAELILCIFKKSKYIILISYINCFVASGLVIFVSIITFMASRSDFMIFVWIIVIILALLIFVLSIVLLIKNIKNDILIKQIMGNNLLNSVVINSKKGKTYIFPETKELFHGYEKINIDEIIDVELVNRASVLAKSSLSKAIVEGVLFDSLGASTGSYGGSYGQASDDYKIVFKTDNIYHATMFISASYEDCIKIADTVFLLRKNLGKELEEVKSDLASKN